MAADIVPKAKGPGVYSDIGKETRDLLYKDYHESGLTFSLSTFNSMGAITCSCTSNGGSFSADLNTLSKDKTLTSDIKIDMNSKVSGTGRLKPTPETSIMVDFIPPNCPRVNLRYNDNYVGISSNVEVNETPKYNLSCMIGGSEFSLGSEVTVDTSDNSTTCELGYQTSHDFTHLGTTMGKKTKLYVLQKLEWSAHSAVGFEFAHRFTDDFTSLTMGMRHLIDPSTLVKARVDNCGKMNAIVQHEWRPMSFFTLLGEVDVREIWRSAKEHILTSSQLRRKLNAEHSHVVISFWQEHILTSSQLRRKLNAEHSHGESSGQSPKE